MLSQHCCRCIYVVVQSFLVNPWLTSLFRLLSSQLHSRLQPPLSLLSDATDAQLLGSAGEGSRRAEQVACEDDQCDSDESGRVSLFNDSKPSLRFQMTIVVISLLQFFLLFQAQWMAFQSKTVHQLLHLERTPALTRNECRYLTCVYET